VRLPCVEERNNGFTTILRWKTADKGLFEKAAKPQEEGENIARRGAAKRSRRLRAGRGPPSVSETVLRHPGGERQKLHELTHRREVTVARRSSGLANRFASQQCHVVPFNRRSI